MQQFCSVTLQQSSLYKKFAPLLSEIRSKHINSIHQLPQNFFNFQKKDQLSKTMGVFTRDHQQSQHQNYVRQNQKFSKTQKIKSMLTNRVRSPQALPFCIDSLNDYRVILINPASKIKAHLVKAIDFDQVEKALYARPKQKDRFTAFCQRIEKKTKDCFQMRNSDSIQNNKSSKGIKVLDLGEKINIFPIQKTKQKFYIKKKFWSRGKTQDCSRKNPEWLHIETNKTALRNFQLCKTAK